MNNKTFFLSFICVCVRKFYGGIRVLQTTELNLDLSLEDIQYKHWLLDYSISVRKIRSNRSDGVGEIASQTFLEISLFPV